MKLLALAVTLAGTVALAGCDKHSSEARAAGSPGIEGAEGAAALAATPVEGAVKVVHEDRTPASAGAKTAEASEGGSCGDAMAEGSCGGAKEGEESAGGCNQWDEAASEVAKRPIPADADWKTIAVSGMTCGGCERRVIAKLGALDGVLAVEADAELGQVRVATARGVDLRQAAVDRINELGYKAQ